MMAETVTIDVPSVSQRETGQATVTAVFQMRNLVDVEERMDMRFPLCAANEGGPVLSMQGYFYFLLPIESFSVWIDDKAGASNQNQREPGINAQRK